MITNLGNFIVILMSTSHNDSTFDADSVDSLHVHYVLALPASRVFYVSTPVHEVPHNAQSILLVVPHYYLCFIFSLIPF